MATMRGNSFSFLFSIKFVETRMVTFLIFKDLPDLTYWTSLVHKIIFEKFKYFLSLIMRETVLNVYLKSNISEFRSESSPAIWLIQLKVDPLNLITAVLQLVSQLLYLNFSSTYHLYSRIYTLLPASNKQTIRTLHILRLRKGSFLTCFLHLDNTMYLKWYILI